MITDEQVKAAKEAFNAYPDLTIEELPNAWRAAIEAADDAAWRPIDEALKDGTLFQVWRKNHPVVTAYWNKNLSCWKNPNPALFEPTHFRPLPNPPKEPT